MALSPCGGDHWSVEGVEVTAQVEGIDGGVLLASQHGAPWAELSSGESVVEAYEGYDPPAPTTGASHLLVTITTGDDGLAATDVAEALVLLRGEPAPLRLPLNDGIAWAGGSTQSMLLRLPDGVTLGNLEAFGVGLRSPSSSALWTLKEIALEALSDPVQSWLAAYQDAQALAGGSIAMGTDLNGLAPQIRYSAEKVVYPFEPLGDGGCTAGRACLHACKTGNRTFDLSEDGIAHIGLVPDFLQAARQLDGGPQAIEKMYRTADDVIQMWYRVEAAKRQVQ